MSKCVAGLDDSNGEASSNGEAAKVKIDLMVRKYMPNCPKSSFLYCASELNFRRFFTFLLLFKQHSAATEEDQHCRPIEKPPSTDNTAVSVDFKILNGCFDIIASAACARK